jgi:hypothetical protein
VRVLPRFVDAAESDQRSDESMDRARVGWIMRPEREPRIER